MNEEHDVTPRNNVQEQPEQLYQPGYLGGWQFSGTDTIIALIIIAFFGLLFSLGYWTLGSS